MDDDHEREKLRQELTATRIVAFGLIVVALLSLYGASRSAIWFAFLGVLLVAVFLGCRWGLGDSALSLGPSVAVTLGVGAVFLLLMLWGGGL
jgi:hypothetical protein